jgi:4-hydroxymandelate oxidase
MSTPGIDRRNALKRVGAVVTDSCGRSQNGASPTRRTPPLAELINVLEFEEVAKLLLPAATYATIAGGDRSAFDRMTFRPRMCVPTVDLDLTVDLLGEPHFTPILVGPVADQRRYHQEGELATVRGASVAKATVIVSSQSSVPIGDIAKEAKTPLWYSVYADGKSESQLQQAVAAGCKVVCITVGATRTGAREGGATRAEWNAVEQLRKRIDLPVVIKGVMTPQDAQTAIAQGARGIILSNHGSQSPRAMASIDVVSSVAEAVAGKAAVLVDGSFRRGSDILKALALGANGVVLARPVMWGLAAYGADGVQSVIEMLQSDLGRHMGALGAPDFARLTRSMVKVHLK